MENHVNILLVEDNDVDVQIFKRVLKRLDISGTFVRAKDGLEALEILSADQAPYPNLILLDINMPRMNGHEFLAEVRSNERLRDARVFIFTTSDSKRDIDCAYKNNANGYIVKPTGLSELSEIVLMLKKFWDICKHPLPKAAAV